MQCPPIPGLGENGIKPYGLVVAPSIILKIFKLSLSDSIFKLFTSEILTNLNVFSYNFINSASSNDEDL